jgi:hypothetical protein
VVRFEALKVMSEFFRRPARDHRERFRAGTELCGMPVFRHRMLFAIARLAGFFVGASQRRIVRFFFFLTLYLSPWNTRSSIRINVRSR